MPDKKSSFLKSLFVAEEETISIPLAENRSVNRADHTDLKEAAEQLITSLNTPKPVSKTKQILIDVLEDEGNKKIGYNQYKKSLIALKSIIPDEKTRFASAFIASASLGLTKENLLFTLEDSKKVLEKEKIRFDGNITSDLDEELKNNQNQVISLQDNIAKKTEELKKLTEEIAELQKNKKEAEDYIVAKQNKVEKLKEDFNYSYNELNNELDSDLSKIRTYLQ